MNKDTPYLLLMGGTDISPHYYNELPHPETDKPDEKRDEVEFVRADYAVKNAIPVIGICRGAQLLCAYNKGKLHQHVPQHRNNSHPIITNEGEPIYNVAADHHQCMIPSGNYQLFAYAEDNNPEVVYWPDTKCLAVQPHPEWMPPAHPFNVWLDSLILKLFNLKVKF